MTVAGGPKVTADWERVIAALPEHPHGDDAQQVWLNGQLTYALTAEINSLRAGETLLLGARFGNGRVTDVSMRRSGARPTSDALASLVGRSDWRPATASPPTRGGSREFVPAASGRLAAPVRAPWHADTGLWTSLAERLVGLPDTLGITVAVTREGAASLAAHSAAALRRRRHGEPAAPAVPVLASDVISVRMFVDASPAGAAALSEHWLAETGDALAPVDEVAGCSSRTHGLEREVRMLLHEAVTADLAARLLPIPVVDAHSPVIAPRVAPRVHQQSVAADAATELIIGVSDAGVAAGIPALTVNQHALLIGDTGYGKTTTATALLHQGWTRFRIPFLVIDPLKRDFSGLQVEPAEGGPERAIRHLVLGSRAVNVLAVPRGVDRQVFASLMAEAFASTTSLGEAFPLGHAVARSAFSRLYRSTAVPTMADLMAAFMVETNRDDLRNESGANVRASLGSRLRSLTDGPAGEILAGDADAVIDWDRLSEEPTVLTFAHVLPHGELATVYAFLVAAHAAWRTANPSAHRHLLVLEEAELVFGRDNAVADHMLSQLIATMRSRGQGYLVISQHPSQLSDRVVSLIPNVFAHRLLHSTGTSIPEVLGVEARDLRDLQPGEMIVVAGPGASRASRLRALTVPVASYDSAGSFNTRVEEFVANGGARRAWCDRCPKACTGADWLRYRESALAGARTSDALPTQVVGALGAVRAAARAEGVGAGSPAALYCAAASAVTALHSATPDTADAGRRAVRHAIDQMLQLRRRATAGTTRGEG